MNPIYLESGFSRAVLLAGADPDRLARGFALADRDWRDLLVAVAVGVRLPGEGSGCAR
jgi:hypothetical protein